MALDPRIAPAANTFGRAAAAYEQARPTYPPEAIAVLTDELGVGPGSRVIDLAAGTGKLTRLLVAAGADVIAVEPVPGIRDQLAASVPDVCTVDGTAEAIPLEDASADVVTVGQAFHWFDFDSAFAEVHRVLRPGGVLAILFNERDSRTPWVATWNEAIEWHARTISVYQRVDWSVLLSRPGYVFGGGAHFEWAETMTRELVAARVRSVSYIADASPEVQQEYVDRVLALVAGFPTSFALPYITHVWWARTDSTFG